MNSYMALRGWVDSLDAKHFAGLTVLGFAVLAAAVFGIIPYGGLLFVHAVLRGAVWAICLAILLLGGRRIDIVSTTGVALLAGGLTTTIPSAFYEVSPVDWGSTLAVLGLLILMVRWCYDIVKRWRHEHEAGNE